MQIFGRKKSKDFEEVADDLLTTAFVPWHMGKRLSQATHALLVKPEYFGGITDNGVPLAELAAKDPEDALSTIKTALVNGYVHPEARVLLNQAEFNLWDRSVDPIKPITVAVVDVAAEMYAAHDPRSKLKKIQRLLKSALDTNKLGLRELYAEKEAMPVMPEVVADCYVQGPDSFKAMHMPVRYFDDMRRLMAERSHDDMQEMMVVGKIILQKMKEDLMREIEINLLNGKLLEAYTLALNTALKKTYRIVAD